MSILVSQRLEVNESQFSAPIIPVFLVPPTLNLTFAIPLKALVDTGSDYSAMSLSVFKRVRRVAANADAEHLLARIADLKSPWEHFSVGLAFSDKPSSVIFESPVGIALAEKYVAKILSGLNAPEMLLGRDFLSQLVLLKVGESVHGAPNGGVIKIRSRYEYE